MTTPKNTGAGKGCADTRSPNFKARDDCPIWDNIGPAARERRRIKADDESELYEQIETHKILYEEVE